LLVLGVVRIFQPVHGYFVRRELLSWHAEDWAHLNPGSVYNALRSLTREGVLEEVGTETEGGRPARTTYRLTASGEDEFQALLHDAFWKLTPYEPGNLLAAWSFAWALPRSEVIASLEHRLEQIADFKHHTDDAIEGLAADPETPDHVADLLRLSQAWVGGEAAWIRDVLTRLGAGEYWFEGEPNRPWSSPPPAGAQAVVAEN
jgi:DNA-binding PadR family transcriptional regulator